MGISKSLSVWIQICVYLLCSSTVSSSSARVNMALYKPTQQVGTLVYKKGGVELIGHSSYAVDGNAAVELENSTCARTTSAPKPWWTVDLQDNYIIKEVEVVQRDSGVGFDNFRIEVSQYRNESTYQLVSPVLCYAQAAGQAKGTSIVYPCISEIVGRYITVTRDGNGKNRSMTLCQFMVYGSHIERYFFLKSHVGKRSTGNILDSQQPVSPMQCAIFCKTYANCTSFNLESGTRRCELIADPLISLPYFDAEVDDPNWTYFYFEL